LSDVLPQALDAENYVLGAMLQSEKATGTCSDMLNKDCFFSEKHGIIFETMTQLFDNGKPTHAIIVEAALKEKGVYEQVGGQGYLYGLIGLAPATANVHVYATLVRDAWKKRLVLSAATKILNDIETMSAEDAVNSLDEASLAIEQKTDEKHELVVDMKDLIAAKRFQVEHPQSAKIGIPSPFAFLPELIGGRLYVLSGYMGDGKTSAALQFASAAAKAGENVGIASAEMSKADLFDRWACQLTGLDYWKVKNPHLLSPREREILEETLTAMEPWRVQVIDDEGLDPGSLRRYQRTGKYDILLVDHLHRMRWKDRHDLENNIRTITNIAREFEIPVVLLAQLSRAGDYAKPFPVPSMRQLRETAMLEAEASAVWFVYRERDENHVQMNKSQFIIAKNRYGRVGTETMYFDDASQSFKEMDWEPVESEVEEVKDAFPF
jgi:replicative DNA helicase